MNLFTCSFSVAKAIVKIEWMKLQNKSVIRRSLERTAKERESRVL